MRINSMLGTQHATFDGSDAGEGLAIFLSQNPFDFSRFRLTIKAMLGEGVYQVGVIFSSPPRAVTSGTPPGALTRMIGGAVCPGATSWAVDVCAMDDGEGIRAETAEIILASSRCFTSPIGASRVNERYRYSAGDSDVTGSLDIVPGQTVKSWSAVANKGIDGFVNLWGGDLIIVPNGFSVSGTPDDAVLALSTMTFNGVDWFVEYMESA